ncbi:PrsW family intramembrane metalloprotease [bacterium]|nr:PrsW family intramembrane metalloprotease [bacterium]
MNIFLFSVIAAFIPVSVYVLFLRWLDRYEPEPLLHTGLAFLGGATLSVGFSFVINTAISAIGYSVMTESGSEFFSAAVVAPFVEEINKGLVVLLFFILSDEFDTVTDGIFYGAVVGLGFAFSENIYYFTNVYKSGGQFNWFDNIYTRSLLSAGVHASATGLFGAAVAYSYRHKWLEKIGTFLVGLMLAMMVHSFWNALLTEASLSQDRVLQLVPFIGLPIIMLTMFLMFQISVYKESAIIEQELLFESQNGVIPPEHISFIKSYFARSKDHWLEKHVPKDKYIDLTTSLAFTRNRIFLSPTHKRPALEKTAEELRGKIKSLLAKNP